VECTALQYQVVLECIVLFSTVESTAMQCSAILRSGIQHCSVVFVSYTIVHFCGRNAAFVRIAQGRVG
jgi:hypothetical protein